MQKKIMLSAFALVALTACGGSSTSSIIRRDLQWENPFAGTANETVTLSVWAGSTTESMGFANAVLEDFKKANPDSNYEIKLKAVSESSVNGDWANDPKQAADFAICADDQMPQLIASNYLQKIKVLDAEIPGLSAAIESRNDADSVEASKSKGDLYGFPVSSSNGYVLYYNSDLLKESDCASFETLLAAIKAAGEKDGKKYTFGFPHASGWYLDGYFHGAGFTATGEADGDTITANWHTQNEAGLKGVDVAASLVRLAHGQYKDQWLSEKEATLVSRAAKGVSGRVIATINGTWNYKALQKAWGESACSATLLPKFTVSAGQEFRMHTVKGSKIGVLNRSSQHVKEAARFAEFFTNYSSQVMRFDNLGETPSNKESLKICDLNTNACLKAMAEQRVVGGFVEKVNPAFWNPANALSTNLCAGNAGKEHSFITSGEGTAELVLNMEEIQAALDACNAGFTKGN
ncbi:MAG: extracellular solute-binding protein [Erysipelotrichaceae bacterium]|nr:extracellular solute-binding protein [Erysipelotrichaceae bacterium]